MTFLDYECLYRVHTFPMNFKPWEFRCKCSCNSLGAGIPFKLLRLLQYGRDQFGPLKISSGFRCPFHNKAIGGTEYSYHLIGMAADVIPLQASVDDLYYFFLEKTEATGVGFYRSRGFVHVDVRVVKSKQTWRE